jgi:hypothetical protein
MHTQITHTESKSSPAIKHPQFSSKVHTTPFFQPKLTVNQPNDPYEQEADAVADQVMRMRDGDAPVVQRMFAPSIQRACAHCEGKQKKEEGIQRKENTSVSPSRGDGSGAAPSIVSDVLSSGGGQPMDTNTQQFMGSRMGQDFSNVRIHTGSKAAESASAIQARAYTSGTDIVFGKGEYQPSSERGKRLLAHELVHVGQQGGVQWMVQRNLLGTAIGGGIGLLGGAVGGAALGNALGRSTGWGIAGGVIGGISGLALGMAVGDLISGNGSTDRPSGPNQVQFLDCAPTMQTEINGLVPQALSKVDNAVSVLSSGRSGMSSTQLASFLQFFDPARTGTIDDNFVNEVRDNFRRVRHYMNNLTFNCGNRNLVVQSTNSMCTGGRLAWTMFGHLNICTTAWQNSSNQPFKIETIIHESIHNALEVTDRAYQSNTQFNRLRPRGNSDTEFYSAIPGLRRVAALVGNDTLHNPDSYAAFAMAV